eukprot:CAMPEP_0176176422 /NCGR_PEP_ID=MMETSP0120_2-20121206/90368_1 /TAXON_ID=160619 /ORGANISM="Kryptoperidinium foliaceum, Strain CCMP 1326" /LENGTH=229 /DNA_ID=CAMNT_0017514469 /DNA_START=1 /DNA_END=688 /DNA_ORIENTATION=+
MTPEALVLCGPVIGKVTDTSANILLEVDGKAEIVCIATPADLRHHIFWHRRGAHAIVAGKGLQSPHLPAIRLHEELADYRGELRLSNQVVDDGATNPWANVASLCKSGDCDVMLHLGDQVYTWENGRMLAAQAKMEGIRRDFTTPEVAQRMELNASRELQESYNFTWSLPEQASALAHSSHLMIWSDNDVTNDFTVLRKPDGSQEYSAEFLTVAMQVYRIYQRSLWDPS